MMADQQRYAVFIRGLNIGKYNSIKAVELKQVFVDAGFDRVRTFINSGNVAVDASLHTLEAQLARAQALLTAHINNPARMLVRSFAELESLVIADPFSQIEITNPNEASVSFLSQPVALTIPAASARGDVVLVAQMGSNVFSIRRTIGDRAGDPQKFIETTAGCWATSRFWHTMQRFIDKEAHS